MGLWRTKCAASWSHASTDMTHLGGNMCRLAGWPSGSVPHIASSRNIKRSSNNCLLFEKEYDDTGKQEVTSQCQKDGLS